MALIVACNIKRSGKYVSNTATSLPAQQKVEKPLNLDSMLSASVYTKEAVRVWNYSKEVVKSLTSYDSLTESQTKEKVSKLVSLVETKSAYHKIVLDEEGGQKETFKIASVVLCNTTSGHFKISIWRTMKNAFCFVSIDQISIQGNNVVSQELSLDSKGDGFIHPDGGNDIAVWPSPVESSWEFANLTQNQHEYANKRYVRLVDLLIKGLESSGQ